MCFPWGMLGGGAQGIPAAVQNEPAERNCSTKVPEGPQSVGHKLLSCWWSNHNDVASPARPCRQPDPMSLSISVTESTPVGQASLRGSIYMLCAFYYLRNKKRKFLLYRPHKMLFFQLHTMQRLLQAVICVSPVRLMCTRRVCEML